MLRRSVAALLLFACGFAAPAFAQRSPEEELKALRVPEGMELSLYASEPLITNPAAIDIDSHGRVWVAEIQWYRRAAKQPPADKIKVLEDTNGDGRADKATVFAEGLFCPMSICVAGTKVYVATSPDLWVFEDRDGDLKADGPPTKLLTGFGGFNHDHGAHSLVLGPDHKWWMSHGDTGFKVMGTDGSQIEYKWGGMLRGELDGSQLEQIAVNFRNPYEIAVSSFGESFCSDNDNDGNFSVRICWILEGGNYGWFGGPPFKKEELNKLVPPGTPYREAWHFRGWQPGYVPGTLVTGFGSPCGMCFYEGDALGKKFKNAPLHADAGPREVRVYRHEPAGYGMTATSENFITAQGDNYFRPDDVCTAPDGSIFVSDWYDGGVGGHAYNDPDRGRIFRMAPAGKKLASVAKPGPYGTIDEALEGLKSANLATQFLARERLLAEGEKSVEALEGLINSDEPNNMARALWVLDRIGGTGRKVVVEQLSNPDAAFRALAVRILRRHGETYAKQILALAGDASPEVAREVLLACGKLPGDASLAPIAKLATKYDGKDRYQLETLNIAAGDRKEQLYASLNAAGQWSYEKLPLMQAINPKAAADYVATQLAKSGLDAKAAAALLDAAGAAAAPETGTMLLALAGDTSVAGDVRRAALAKVAANLTGNWKTLADDPQLVDMLKKFLAEPGMQAAALQTIDEQGLNKLAPDVRALAVSPATENGLRQQAIAAASRLNGREFTPALRALLADKQAPIRAAALTALIERQDMTTLRDVLSAGKAAANVQAATANKLLDNIGGALVLLRLIDEKRLSSDLQAAVIAKAADHPDSNVRVLYEKYVPLEKRPQRLGAAIKAEEILALAGDAKRGERIFHQSTAAQCKNCHVVQGVGTALGPDLSQVGRKYERRTLLETILDPSKAIAPEFKAYLLQTTGGQVFAGFLIEKSDKQVVLRDIKNQLVRVPADEVEVLEPQPKSLMPELVLRDVTAQDAADLLAYLTTLASDVQQAGRFQAIGPFGRGDERGLDFAFPPEKNLASLDLSAEYKGARQKTLKWAEVRAADAGGYLAVDQVKLSQALDMPTERVVYYYLVYADSAADQTATLLLGSDDGCIAWVNGKQVHRFQGSRAIGYAQDKVDVPLKAGRNTILLKVENVAGPGGVSLAVKSPSPLQLQ